MTVVNFLKDLGIIPNKGTKDENNANLLQGQNYKDYERIYMESAKPHLILLEQGVGPQVKSVIEALEGLDSTKNNNTPLNNSTNKNNMNETEFNKTMSEYSAVYQSLIEELIKQKNNKDYKPESDLNQKLDSLNEKLIFLSEKIEADTNNIKSDNTNMKQMVKNKQKTLNAHINFIKQETNKNKLIMNEDNTLTGQTETTKLLLKANYYLYIFWGLLFFLILFLIVKVITSNSSNNILLLTIIIAISIVFLYLKN
jgi:hypothetical protein